MAEKEKDVDLYDQLEKELGGDKEAVRDEIEKKGKSKPKDKGDGASSGKPEEKVETPKDNNENLDGEFTEEEISKLSPRAQKRIRELAEEVRKLAEKPAEKPDAPQEKKDESVDPKNVEEFLAAVEDEPSRELLRKFYKVVKTETDTVLAPVEQKNNETRFETEFNQYAEKIDGLKDHYDDLKKTFMRDPKQSVKGLISDLALELQMSKIKPVDKGESDPKRDGVIDIDSLDKDQLYDLLESGKPK